MSSDTYEWSVEKCGPIPQMSSEKARLLGFPDPTPEREGSSWTHAEICHVPKGVRLSAVRKGSWMLTYTGRVYWPMDPRPSEVCIEDIAHSLAYQCRYGGHCREYYSVAEHCVLMSRLLPPPFKLVGLMHDSPEGYVVDVPRPIKPYLSNYEGIEARNWEAIAAAFDLPLALPPEVEDLDRRMCLREMCVLMPKAPLPLEIEGEMPSVYIERWAPKDAEFAFLQAFDHLWQLKMWDRFPAAKRTEARYVGIK